MWKYSMSVRYICKHAYLRLILTIRILLNNTDKHKSLGEIVKIVRETKKCECFPKNLILDQDNELKTFHPESHGARGGELGS